MSSPKRSILSPLASLQLTVVLLLLSIVMIFAATLDQVHLGVWGVQQKYFRAFFVYVRPSGTGFVLPVFPGGYLLGSALLINLIAAHVQRFRFTAKKIGIWLTHAGLILLIAGEGLSGVLQRDNQIRIDVGQTRRYSESVRDMELAVIDTTDPRFDEVVAIPSSRLGTGSVIQHPKLPFRLKSVAYYANATRDGAPLPLATKADDANWPAAAVELSGPDGVVGTFLVSALADAPESFRYQGRTWALSLRSARDYLPFAITLDKFTHAVYAGTDIPRDFASTIHLRSDDGRDDREVRIFMNNPLRYGGRAFYQAGYANHDRTAVLQVVRNPGWRLPYLACALMALGMVIQFGLHLFAFLRHEKTSSSRSTPARARVGRLDLGAPAGSRTV